MFLIIPTTDYQHQWVCYTLKDSTGSVVHVGIVKWTALTMFHDVEDMPPGSVYLTIVDSDTDRLKLANRMIPLYQWRIQEIVSSWSHGNKRFGNPVMCVDTGQQWGSVKACCDEQGLSYSQMISHLKGMVGYKKVKGKVYRRV